ncbi:MAG: hypothetical protein Q4G61_11140 [Tissierellia bacterium]|nr:hypothetical protein [Tissierellia bacterium]
MKRKLFQVLSLLLVACFMLVGCGKPATQNADDGASDQGTTGTQRRAL